MTGSRWWTKTAFYGALAGGALLVLGALGSRAGIWPFSIGFSVAAAGLATAAVAGCWGIGALVVALRRALRTELPALLTGLGVSLVVLGAFAVQLVRLFTLPPLHQVTTDPDDPPAFDAIAAVRPEGSNPHTYDPDQPILDSTLAEAQQRAWPELVALDSSLDPQAALERAIATVEGMGMAVVNVDRTKGIVEATDTTLWFGFKDDVVVRVRARNVGSVIDARSVSRVGVADLGANARRVLNFLERFAADDD